VHAKYLRLSNNGGAIGFTTKVVANLLLRPHPLNPPLRKTERGRLWVIVWESDGEYALCGKKDCELGLTPLVPLSPAFDGIFNVKRRGGDYRLLFGSVMVNMHFTERKIAG